MIKIVYGNIFDQDVDALVNPVNTVGVMGAGLAKQFKIQYPDMFNWYKEECKNDQFNIGEILYYFSSEDKKWIINFPTKKHWKDQSTLEYIEEGLKGLCKDLVFEKAVKINSIAIPALGCGLGGLNWNNVKNLIYEYLSNVNFDVIIVLGNKQ